MDWLQFLSSVISSLAWPSAVVGLAWMMRHPLSKLIPLIRTLKYKEWQIDIGEQLEAVRDQVDAESDAPPADTEEPPSSFKAMAKANPRAAVLSAWFPVEAELYEISAKKGIDRSFPPMGQLRELYKDRVIDELTYKTLNKLRRIRNSASHADVTFEDAMNMSEMCQWATGQLKHINENLSNYSEPT